MPPALPARPWTLLGPPRQIDLLRTLPVRRVVGRPDGGAEILRGCESIGVDAEGHVEADRLLGACDEILDANWSDGRLRALLVARSHLTLATPGATPIRLGQAKAPARPGDLAARLLATKGGLAAVFHSSDGMKVVRIGGAETRLSIAPNVRYLDAAASGDEVVVLATETDPDGAQAFVLQRVAADGTTRRDEIGSFPPTGGAEPVGFVAPTLEGYLVWTAIRLPSCEGTVFPTPPRLVRVPLQGSGAVPLSITPPDESSVPVPAGLLDDGLLVHWRPCGRGPLRLQVIAPDGRASPVSEIRDTFAHDFLVSSAGDRVTVVWDVSSLARVAEIARRSVRLPESWIGPEVAGRTTTIPAGSALAEPSVSDMDGDGVPEGVAILLRDADAPAVARLARDGTSAWRAEPLCSLGNAVPATRAQERVDLRSSDVEAIPGPEGRAHVVRAQFANADVSIEWLVVVTASSTSPVVLDFAVPPMRVERGDRFVGPRLRALAGGAAGEIVLEVAGRRLPLRCEASGCQAKSPSDLDRVVTEVLSGVGRRPRPEALGLVSAARALSARFARGVELAQAVLDEKIQAAQAQLPAGEI